MCMLSFEPRFRIWAGFRWEHLQSMLTLELLADFLVAQMERKNKPQFKLLTCCYFMSHRSGNGGLSPFIFWGWNLVNPSSLKNS